MILYPARLVLVKTKYLPETEGKKTTANMVSNNTRTLPPLDPATAAESNTETLLSVMGTFTFLALLMVSLRIYTRIRLVKSVGWDDWLMSTAMVCHVAGMPPDERGR